MVDKEREKKLEDIKEKILSYFQNKDIELIYIFGSYATGENKEDSDIDIAVLYNEKKSELDVYNEKRRLVDILDEEVDLINLGDANIIIQNQIVTKGLNIYSKNINTNIEYKYRTVVCYGSYRDDSKVIRDNIKKRGYVWKDRK